ncbi:hypothetical protein I6B53_09585 [Schaalia sp. 19OD2882]|uniref:hypothetical protein n=1 Tax=Schaalia sp. 19OD2882 TaxID=2794089 RepID=UPI001C1F1196|nr:hypothetical protein [Schaalia sp. 19OD2882]QWW19334.1 hypothetical protein I6B53_09585 [Schaalia sp. 19OD2882]
MRRALPFIATAAVALAAAAGLCLTGCAGAGGDGASSASGAASGDQSASDSAPSPRAGQSGEADVGPSVSGTPVDRAQSGGEDGPLVDGAAYAFASQGAASGRSGHWFANTDHTLRCLLLAQQDPPKSTLPGIHCDFASEFPVTAADAAAARCEEKAGAFKGWSAWVDPAGVHLGACQSDVPIGVLCTQLEAGSQYCRREWDQVPVLPDGMSLAGDAGICAARNGRFTCTLTSGATIEVGPGHAVELRGVGGDTSTGTTGSGGTSVN